MSNEKDSRGNITYLKEIIGIFAFAFLSIIYIFVLPVPDKPNNTLIELIRQIIPNIIAALIGFYTIYFFFYKKGLTDKQLDSNSHAIAQEVINHINNQDRTFLGILNFYETYNKCEWDRLLNESRNCIDVVVYYYDSWIKTNHEGLVTFFQKPDTKIRIFVSDPDNEMVLDMYKRLFRDTTIETTKEKVKKTGLRILSVAEEAGVSPERIQLFFVPHVLNYAAQCFDKNTLALSFFELNREVKISSPVILLDLNKSKQLEKFWEKELEYLLKVSKRKKLDNTSDDY